MKNKNLFIGILVLFTGVIALLSALGTIDGSGGYVFAILRNLVYIYSQRTLAGIWYGCAERNGAEKAGEMKGK